MYEEKDIRIDKLIVHILDNNVQLPVLSHKEQPLESDIEDFLKKHISRIFNDDNLKSAHFVDGNNRVKELCEVISNNKEEYGRSTAEMSQLLFGIMQRHVDIPSADMLFCLFNAGDSRFLAILKFNYKHSYIHYTQADKNERVNLIIKQRTTLAGENQKVEECAIINLNDFSIKLLEKKYEINGEKTFYLSQMFLKCSSNISVNEKVKIFTRVTEKFNKKYFDEDYSKPVEVKKAVAQSIEEKEYIDIEKVAQNVFQHNIQLKNEYMEEVEKAGFKDKTIAVSEKIAERKFKKQKLKTDTGIEINLPLDYYGDTEKIEFLNNPDGTISIIIKNINRITDK